MTGGQVIPMQNDITNYRSYLRCVQDLLDSPEVQSMKDIPHHPGTSCYEHSVFVSYVAFRLARRWGLDYTAAARAGLLHDLYLYDARNKPSYYGAQCFAHPVAALKNAWALCGSLTPMEENIIVSHMWPLSRRMPRYKEAVVVNLADKMCATAEVCRLYHYLKHRNRRRRHMAAHAA
ncbi:HD domain-containing protein [uncultured Intestinimonas sp.]|uniref:HD domain-containing protein n=1 Tax=uncultured Intestinimonas sp. TaxID=1689265 RepID=UPI0025E0F3B2|nr:HD domain-containing protein [uncultured Intestinimonas sp.]